MGKEEFLSKAASGLLYTDELAQGFAEHYLLEGKAGPDFCRDMCLYASASAAQEDLTVSELADLIGYSRQSVYNFLSGDNWNRFMAAALAEKLNISKEDI